MLKINNLTRQLSCGFCFVKFEEKLPTFHVKNNFLPLRMKTVTTTIFVFSYSKRFYGNGGHLENSKT